jgi:ribosome-binding factor A
MSSQIKQIVAEFLLARTKDPCLRLVTITDVKLTGDLQNAKIYWTILNGAQANQVGRALDRVTGFVRTAVAEQLNTRLAPTITFEYDEIRGHVATLEELLHQAKVRDAEISYYSMGAVYSGGENPYRPETLGNISDIIVNDEKEG